MSAAETLLSRLDGVRATGAGRWVAKCPAHDDSKPSLSIRQIDDRTLIHCWAGCGAGEIVASLGLELADLFDEHDRHRHVEPGRPYRPLPSSRELMALIEFDLAIVECVFVDVLCGAKFDDEARVTASASMQSIRNILGACHDAR